ncbi:hypothetical protein CEXT_364731 [Caerostris extrusa]|uniref:Uncharacterized protein n=1 Tax=Caerostris extrusa TaxID=172846 RepID=A0AAV4X9S7_CAEEX|nr:hypothetical protein CEXT_364731 [Caerostris extrusa]
MLVREISRGNHRVLIGCRMEKRLRFVDKMEPVPCCGSEFGEKENPESSLRWKRIKRVLLLSQQEKSCPQMPITLI